MADDGAPRFERLRADPHAPLDVLTARIRSSPLEDLQPSDPALFRAGAELELFARLRRDAPVHRQEDHEFGPYWSVTRYDDIMAVDTDHAAFSSEPVIHIGEPEPGFHLPMFIAMDPPRHEAQRRTVQPIVAGPNLAALEPLIRERAAHILDDLPVGETFDWVDRVSVEITTMTLATLFDMPQADRRKLAWWSEIATLGADSLLFANGEAARAERQVILRQCADYFMDLWRARVDAPPAGDLISLLAHGESTRGMTPEEFLGDLILLIVGGSDTTRDTLTGSVLALSENPGERAALQADPERLIPAMVSETIRWQTPLAHMRRQATRDVELGGRPIRAGDKVVMWYVSGNRDERRIAEPDRFWIERPDVRRHLSFGFGIHRCLGARLAEMQLKIVWEEILARFAQVEVVGPPERIGSTFVRGYRRLPVRLHPR